MHWKMNWLPFSASGPEKNTANMELTEKGAGYG